jgi:hypothetical protein
MSTSNQAPLDKTRSRLPAPTLFVGPPSRNASNTSLPQSKDRPTTTRASLTRQKSLLGDNRSRPDARIDNQLASPDGASVTSPFSRRPHAVDRLQTEKQSAERTEAKWVEMQHTLEEVELSASSGTHVFGPHHSEALEGLRTAQIALAQAWARSETEEETHDEQVEVKLPDQALVTADVLSTTSGADAPGTSRKTEKHQQGRERSASLESSKSQLEEETENDIALARRRREANDKYFRIVNTAVKDVVAKLEEVAQAMKIVEAESKEIWGDRDSVELGSES